MNTGWLDELIAKKEKAEKPNTMLSLICGALCVAEGIISSNFETFKASLERGQTQPATILKNSVFYKSMFSIQMNIWFMNSALGLEESNSTNVFLRKD